MNQFNVIPSYPDYSANEAGEIISTKFSKTKVLKVHINQYTGYVQVRLTQDGIGRTKKVHRLVMEAFHGVSAMQVNHKNGNKTDNRLENLEYATAKQNSQHAWNLGLNEVCRYSCIRVSDLQVKQIRALKGLITQTEMSTMFGISQAQISRITNKIDRKEVNS